MTHIAPVANTIGQRSNAIWGNKWSITYFLVLLLKGLPCGGKLDELTKRSRLLVSRMMF